MHLKHRCARANALLLYDVNSKINALSFPIPLAYSSIFGQQLDLRNRGVLCQRIVLLGGARNSSDTLYDSHYVNRTLGVV